MLLGMRDLPYLKGGIRIFNEKWEPDSGLNVCMECGMPKITIQIMELRENLDRYDAVRDSRVSYWIPLVLNKLTLACKCRQTPFRLKIHCNTFCTLIIRHQGLGLLPTRKCAHVVEISKK